MPATRLLLLATPPAPAQGAQLHLLRTAKATATATATMTNTTSAMTATMTNTTSATTATMAAAAASNSNASRSDVGGGSSSRWEDNPTGRRRRASRRTAVSAAAATASGSVEQQTSCHCVNHHMAAVGRGISPSSSSSSSSLLLDYFHNPTTTTPRGALAAQASQWRQQQQQQKRQPVRVDAIGGNTRPGYYRMQVAAFATATAPNLTAFPRHGKAVAPQVIAMSGPTQSSNAAMLEETRAATPTTTTAAAVVGTAADGEKSRPVSGSEAQVGGDSSSSSSNNNNNKNGNNNTDRNNNSNNNSDDNGINNNTVIGGKTLEAVVATVAEAAVVASRVADTLESVAQVIELGPPETALMTTGLLTLPSPSTSSYDSDPTAGQPGTAGASTASMPSSTQLLSQRYAPHLTPPPYVHHFDSFSLVRQLEQGGYEQAQAITAMKAVRGLLAINLDMAQSSLVSKSDVENEAYLFKAACAELSIEVRNNRRRADEEMRQQRTILQQEVDIAAQSVNQELNTLNDVVRGLFNDRKMAMREEQKAMESSIQKLNYKITIMLNSEMRSSIESLRWVLVRRSVLGIAFMALLTLATLRYANYVNHEKKRKDSERAAFLAAVQAQRQAEHATDIGTAAMSEVEMLSSS